jgi:hypothetical protein
MQTRHSSSGWEDVYPHRSLSDAFCMGYSGLYGASWQKEKPAEAGQSRHSESRRHRAGAACAAALALSILFTVAPYQSLP